MENAAVHVAAGVQLVAPPDRPARVLIVAGTGNNGGDALAAARHVANAGASISIFLVGNPARLSPDAAVQLRTCRRMQLPISIAKTALEAPLSVALRSLGRQTPDVVVDGLFGTGLSRSVEGTALGAIRSINRLRLQGACVVAIDIPSGLDAGSGKVLGDAVRADMTVTFVGLKTGMLAPEAIEYLGHVAIADIGVPRSLIERLGTKLGVKPGGKVRAKPSKRS